MKLTSLIFFLCISSSATFADFKLPTASSVPGGVAIVALSETYDVKPQVLYKKNQVFVTEMSEPNRYQAIVGLPLNAQIGQHKITILHNQEKTTQIFSIQTHDYPQEHITIQDERKVTPLKLDYARIEKEMNEILNTYATWSSQIPHTLKFALPVEGRRSSQFGLQRVFNGIKKNPHSGLDIAAPLGTKVKAPSNGTVINTGAYFYSGNMVFIDHGQGVITSYAHLNKIDVKPNQFVSKGDIIGEVGKTGRVTGAHLHWSVNLNGQRVNPELFIDEGAQ